MTSRILFTTIGALLLFATTTGAVANDMQQVYGERHTVLWGAAQGY